LGSILGLARRCAEAMKNNGIDQWDHLYPDLATFERDIEAGTLHVAEAAGKILGCVTLSESQDPTYAGVEWELIESRIVVVHRLMIDPVAQGKGLARQLMSYVETLAATQGIQALRLDAFTRNPTALALYDKLGYRRAGIVQLRKGPFWCFEKSTAPELSRETI
jgi:GNAT superfamily N-acetyltransferase